MIAAYILLVRTQAFFVIFRGKRNISLKNKDGWQWNNDNNIIMQCFASCTPITAMFFSDNFSLREMCCLLFMSGRQDYCLHDYNIKYDVRNACDNIDVPLN